MPKVAKMTDDERLALMDELRAELARLMCGDEPSITYTHREAEK